jgi:hypothetical protein
MMRFPPIGWDLSPFQRSTTTKLHKCLVFVSLYRLLLPLVHLYHKHPNFLVSAPLPTNETSSLFLIVLSSTPHERRRLRSSLIPTGIVSLEPACMA